MSNGLLVTGRTPSGDPQGVAPDMAAEIAKRLGVAVAYVKFDRPSQLADAAGTNVWDIGLIGAEPARAEKITFTPAYCEIEATYLVPAGSPISNPSPTSIAPVHASRYGAAPLTICGSSAISSTRPCFDRIPPKGRSINFVAEGLEALAGLRQALLTDVKKLPGAKILPGNFTTVQQAIGTAKPNTAGAEFLSEFRRRSKEVGFGGAPDRESTTSSALRSRRRVSNARHRFQTRAGMNFRLRQNTGLRAEALDDAAYERPDTG
jgi:polar amino acid transport system substrate-binding protein